MKPIAHLILTTIISGVLLAGVFLSLAAAAPNDAPTIYLTPTLRAIEPFATPIAVAAVSDGVAAMPYTPLPPPQLTWLESALNNIVIWVGGPINAQLILYVVAGLLIADTVWRWASKRQDVRD